MARPLRIEFEGAFYHVTARGNEQRTIYQSRFDYEKFKEYLQEAQEKYNCTLHCYVLMTNHYHLIMETAQANLSKVMHYINGSYTTYFNTKRKRTGHLFQGRYKALLVERDNYLLELSRYLHLNPVRAKMVERPEDYPFSSYRAYVCKDAEDIISHDLIWEMISRNKQEAPGRYKAFVEDAIGIEGENPLRNIYGGVILGGGEFIEETLRKFQGKEIAKRCDISCRRALSNRLSSLDIEFIIDQMCSCLHTSKDDIFNKNGKYRDLAVYLAKRYTNLSNRQIGQIFTNLSYSAVTKVCQRFIQKMEKNSDLKKNVETMKAHLLYSSDLSNVKG
ncbi:MAG: transposase [bacterium]